MVRGTDISDNNGNVYIEGLPSGDNGIDFVSLKAAEGLTELDPDFQDWYHRLRDNRPEIVRIPYDFFDFEQEGAPQAEHVLTRGVNYKESGTACLMLDLEADSGSEKERFIIQNRELCIKRVNDYKSTLFASKEYGRQDLIIYSNDDFIKNVLQHIFPDCIFWVASYQKHQPPFITGWEYSFWQYSQYGKITGETTGGYWDLDMCMKPQTWLNKLANR